jgi:hypothetical protein
VRREAAKRVTMNCWFQRQCGAVGDSGVCVCELAFGGNMRVDRGNSVS